MTDIPAGLVNGKAPLLTDFIARRHEIARRLHQLHALLSLHSPPASLVIEFNRLTDVLSGRMA